MAGTAKGVCLQLKGCAHAGFHHPDPDPVTGGNDSEDFHLFWWTMAEWIFTTTWSTVSVLGMAIPWLVFYVVRLVSEAMLATSFGCAFSLRNAS